MIEGFWSMVEMGLLEDYYLGFWIGYSVVTQLVLLSRYPGRMTVCTTLITTVIYICIIIWMLQLDPTFLKTPLSWIAVEFAFITGMMFTLAWELHLGWLRGERMLAIWPERNCENDV